MRNYIIVFSSFIILIFVVAVVIGKNSEQDVSNDVAVSLYSNEPVNSEPLMKSDEDGKGRGIALLEIPILTTSIDEQILYRKGFTTSYNKKTRCPNWVAWHLTSEHSDGPYSRKGVPYYTEDGSVYGIGYVSADTQKGVYFMDLESEEPRQELTDWRLDDNNLSHGHMCPAGDNKWDRAAINQSFLLTNMCPQDQSLNSGGWNKLEEKCRSWASKYGEIYIVAGPIFRGKPSRFLGHIAVPDAFFKVVLCLSGKSKAIGFIYQNDSSSQSMNNKYCTVDHVEEITGFDFFSALPDDIENAVEASSDIKIW